MADLLIKPLVIQAAYCYSGALPTWQDPSRTCQVFRSVVNDVNTYAFEGTKTFHEWLVDFFVLEIPIYQHAILGPLHFGLWIDTVAAVQYIIATQEALGWPPFYLTGHSKGAGQAILAHAALKCIGHAPLATRAFEPPCVGSMMLRDYLLTEDLIWTQTMNSHGEDIVTLIPFGPTWAQPNGLLQLVVPDSDNISVKHEIAAVQTAVMGLP